MAPHNSSFRRLAITCLAGALLSTGVTSSQVDVSLEASFPAPPLLLELLESAAAENQSSYFPLLSSIASGTFTTATTDEALFKAFEAHLQADGHIKDPAALASWRMSLAVHETAPRIESQYELWRSTVHPSYAGQNIPNIDLIEVWTPENGLCSDNDCVGTNIFTGASALLSKEPLDIDRIEGDASQQPWTLVFDPSNEKSAKSYIKWSEKLKKSSRPFRVRYRPSSSTADKPLSVSGYGVELTLKRTDYIVIDDREADDEKARHSSHEVKLENDEVADIRPLSSSELQHLGLNTASYILGEPNPFETLVKVSQDFPKHAAALALHEASKDFTAEHKANRKTFLPAGLNIMFVNGAQADNREFDAFALLEHLRRERKLVTSIQSLGLSAPEAIGLLSHPSIGESQAIDQAQRYDFRDEIEGGNVITWMNDLEKDKRYNQWPSENNALLQRLWPGQLPSLRKNLHFLVYPVDFSKADDAAVVVDNLQALVKRMVPVRFGLVPLVNDETSKSLAKIFYYLTDTYGLATAIEFLTKSLTSGKSATPSEKNFASIVEGRKIRTGRTALTLEEVLALDSLQTQIESAQAYAQRLSLKGDAPPIICNGVAIPRSEEWLQTVSQRISGDIHVMQAAVYEGKVSDDDWLPSLYMEGAALQRNPLIIPETETDVNIIDLAQIHRDHRKFLKDLRAFRSVDKESTSDEASLLILADLNKKESQEIVVQSLKFALEHQDVAVTYVHQSPEEYSTFTVDTLTQIQDLIQLESNAFTAEQRDISSKFLTGSLMSQVVVLGDGDRDIERRALSAALGIPADANAVVLNGRVLGPLPAGTTFSSEDFETLLGYEQTKRVLPVAKAIRALGLETRLTAELSVAKLSALIALSTISDVPEGIFDDTPGPRTNAFTKWASSHSLIERGAGENAQVQLVVALDPTSQVAQRWVPILKALSEMDGVHLKLYLNPKDRLTELPSKRFYRQVLQSKPMFKKGVLEAGKAEFDGLPRDALLTMALDIPPAWLVGAKRSVHDPDNIKLSSLKPGSTVQVVYELQNILIEGHSRDTTLGNPPKGAQLTLSTGSNPDLAGTIAMANLGYFQFRANPGVYSISLKSGATRNIFSLDSAGTKGYSPKPGDNTTQVTLASFKGSTLFPRLSRKPGMETFDVLEQNEMSASALASKSIKVAGDLLAKVGVSQTSTGKLLNKALGFGQKVLGQAGGSGSMATRKKHADINIFSVASGHLYERMLNIMMLSVMKHTQHTVKFWFIEQFLSPSFKQSIPVLAQEYGFDYEMVTYKWPHWLRAQTEKQRTIWGYKILFLDVLFPLDLDKVIFVDADQIVRTDMYDLVTHDLEGAPYGFTPMCDSRTEMEGFRFWKQGYWKNFLRGKPYHISALYVVDLKKFRQIAAGDRLRQQYHQLSADPNSLSNLDQDLPNNMQLMLPIHSLPQEWLWCETWCSDESLKDARTIDLCNNPQTKEPKLDRARRQVPEWTSYDNEIAGVLKRAKMAGADVAEKLEGVNIQEQEQVAAQKKAQEESSTAPKGNRDEL